MKAILGGTKAMLAGAIVMIGIVIDDLAAGEELTEDMVDELEMSLPMLEYTGRGYFKKFRGHKVPDEVTAALAKACALIGEIVDTRMIDSDTLKELRDIRPYINRFLSGN